VAHFKEFAPLQIRKKLLLLVIFVFFSAGVTIVLLGLKSAGESVERAEKETSLLVESMAAQQERVIVGTKYLLSTLARFPAVQSLDPGASNTLFQEIKNEHPFYSFIGATTPNGQVFAASSSFEPGHADLSDRKHFRDAAETLGFSVGEFIRGRVSNELSINFSYPVLDSNGSLTAVLIAGFKLDEYDAFLSGMDLPVGSVVTVIDHKGVRLFQCPARDGAAPGTPIAEDLYRLISGKSEGGIIERIGEDGVKRIYAFKQLRLDAESRPYLYMIVGVPKNLIIHNAAFPILGNLLILATAGLAALFLTWSFGNSMIAEPIKLLVTAAQRIGEGQLGARTNLPHTADELGHLAEAFDNMVALLEKREEALENAYSDLEQRVQERTVELTSSNAALRVEISERKQAESALKESQQRLSQIFDFLPDPTFVIDRTGKVIAWNRSIEDITGLKAKDILGKRDCEYGLPFYGVRRPLLIDLVFESAEKIQEKYSYIRKEGDILLAEADVPMRGGKTRVLAGKARPLYDSAGNVAGAIETIRDITVLKKTQEMLQESEARYRSVVENMQDVFYQTDMEGQITMLSPSASRLYGGSCDEILGSQVTNFWMYPNERAELLQLLERHGVVRDYELTLRKKDGLPVPVSVTSTLRRDGNGNVVGVEGLIRDITARKRAEEERIRLVTAIEQVAEGIIITDANWTIQYANPAFERITGYGRDEIIGLHTSILSSGKHDPNFYEQLEQTLSTGAEWSGRLVNKKKNGSLYDAETTSSAVRDKSGVVINYVSIHRDITPEVQLERELRQAQKMEAIGNLAGGIAHDFNNILAAIMGFTELSLVKTPKTSPVHGNLEQILKAASRASEVVKQILAFSRRSDQQRIPVHIAPIVQEALTLLRSSLPSTIRIEQDMAIRPENGTVLADPTQIHQVLMNLCTNAAHAMRAKGGTLSVRISEITGASLEPGLPDLDGGPYLSLSVSDTGTGMTADVIEQIFDPYFTTKSSREGTGLGLSVVQGIIKSHNGKITVNSEPEVGTTFHILLPETVEAVPPEVEETDRIVPTGRGRILFVDDEEALVDLGKEILESLGYHVTALADSPAALKIFRSRPDEFDLVITDMTMPELSGNDLAKQLMAIRADIPVLMCTGFSDQINAKHAESLGIRDFVMKPYACATLAKSIRNVLKSSDG